jgi:hypothetical protein
MDNEREVTFRDIERAAEQRDPQLAALVLRYLHQGELPAGQPEDLPEGEEPVPGAEVAPRAVPRDAWTYSRLVGELHNKTRGKMATERKGIRRSAWEAVLASPYAPMRLRLADLLAALYEAGDEAARCALVEIFRDAPVGWGLWGAMKRVYKLAEERHDAELFGVLACRFDGLSVTHAGEVERGTLIYMRRRAWRYLRHLGQSVPEIYPEFASQVLRSYAARFNFRSSWVASQIWGHKEIVGKRSVPFSSPPKDLKKRAFDEAWKASAEPLLRLLEDAGAEEVCDFAIRSLQKDFPEALRGVEPAWLARVAAKPVAAVHEFVVKLLEGTPELHLSKLEGLGLKGAVLSMLESASPAARAFAIRYARAHVPDLPVEKLVELVVDSPHKEVCELALSRLEPLPAKKIGLRLLARLLDTSAAKKMAGAKIKEGFAPEEIDADLFCELVTNREQRGFVEKFFEERKVAIPAGHLVRAFEASSKGYDYTGTRGWAFSLLQKRKVKEIGLEWLKGALLDPNLTRQVSLLLSAGKLTKDEVDVEWLKGLVPRPHLRPLALELLGNRKLVEPRQIGLDWLLAMTRQVDEAVAQFARGFLLERFSPEEIAAELGSTDVERGVEKLWSLAAGHGSPEAIRLFAATYLKVHHPLLGPTMQEARSLGITPKLARESYTIERVRPLLSDARPDVRRFAAAIAGQELVRWGDRALLYEMADSRFREGRGVAAEALLQMGEAEADPARVPPLEWLSAPAVFALAESTTKASREVALTLLRRHYARLGGAERLAWLMESPDREVRLFAVRLLWERHRPRETPASWTPRRARVSSATSSETAAVEKPQAGRGDGAARLDEAGSLRAFLRTVLFGLPPGRMERREAGGGDAALPDRAIPASIAKRRLVEVVRDFALEDAGFAARVVPALSEFATSRAKGEWQGCLAALCRIRAAHPGLEVAILDAAAGGSGRDLSAPAARQAPRV